MPCLCRLAVLVSPCSSCRARFAVLVRLTLTQCNLKPVTMRGVKSFAMLLCATAAGGKEDGGVQFVLPPEGSQPGERIYFEGEKYESEWRGASRFPPSHVFIGHPFQGGQFLSAARLPPPCSPPPGDGSYRESDADAAQTLPPSRSSTPKRKSSRRSSRYVRVLLVPNRELHSLLISLTPTLGLHHPRQPRGMLDRPRDQICPQDPHEGWRLQGRFLCWSELVVDRHPVRQAQRGRDSGDLILRGSICIACSVRLAPPAGYSRCMPC
jgi:tRNA-binding EMAP/Myf-like protein